MDDFEWIEDIETTLENVIIEFPKDKYDLDDVNDFMDYIYDNHPYMKTIPLIDPKTQDGGVKYYIEKLNDRFRGILNITDSNITHHMSWSDFNFEGDGYINLNDFLVMEWDQLKKGGINESDDFDWIRDTNSISYENILGNAIEFNPPIKDMDYLNYVLDALMGIGFNTPHITEYDLEYGVVGLYSDSINNRIVWTSVLSNETYQEHIDDFANKSVEVLDGRDLFPET